MKYFNRMTIAFVALCLFGIFSIAQSGPSRSDQKNGLLGSDPNVFPIAVWLQTPNLSTTVTGSRTTRAQAYAGMGVNIFTHIWDEPDTAIMSALEEAGIGTILLQQGTGLSLKRYANSIKGWLQTDEPDNAQTEGAGYGPCIKASVIVDRYRAFKTADPSRPVLLNFGQGVARLDYKGRGSVCAGQNQSGPYSYPEYAKGADILSFDVYPVNDLYPITAVSDGLDNLVKWVGLAKPIWAFVETTQQQTNNGRPTPEQVKAEVWLALTHGASGIQYFVHTFTPNNVEPGIFADPAMYRAVQTTNRQIRKLAPVLNSPTVADAVTVNSPERIDKSVKKYGGKTYVFAVNPASAGVNVSFRLSGDRSASATVIDESRKLEVNAGSFSDRFDGYAVHLYEIDGN